MQTLARVGAVCSVLFAGWTWAGWKLHTRAMDSANAVERKIAQDVGWVEETDGKLVCLSKNANTPRSVPTPVCEVKEELRQ